MYFLKSIREKIEVVIGERHSIRAYPSRIKGYNKKIDTLKYSIFENSRGYGNVVAAYGDMLLYQSYRNKNKLTLFPYYQNMIIRRHIILCEKKFPGLLPNSAILQCFFIPYIRVIAKNQYQKAVRLIIITDKAQVYHNYPSRDKVYDGLSDPGDITSFEESVIWDLPGKRYPSSMVDNNSAIERYYPNLPQECYNYHPSLNTDKTYKDKYNNGGFGKMTMVTKNGQRVNVSRFYIYSRKSQANPFHFIGTGEKGFKMTIIATYRSNTNAGVRTCVFATTDGGRQWFCKYEFADFGEYEFRQGDSESYGTNFGNLIINDGYNDNYLGDLIIKKRILIVPSIANKEPVNKFRWIEIGKVTAISQNKHLTFKTSKPHGLTTGNIISLSSDKDNTSYSWMINNSTSPDSAGNGLLFKIYIIDDNTISLYELVSSPDSDLPCRHIHHVNRIKDGWLIGTGEIYPNGWLLYLQLKMADSFSIVSASDDMIFIRLNSTEQSAQRTMGAFLTDEPVPRIIYASDHDILLRQKHSICERRTEIFMRNSTGVFDCLLSEIDDRTSHRVVFEATEPCFFFQQLNSLFLFSGQRGELGISFDYCKTWYRERLSKPIIHYLGSNGQRYYFDNCIIIRK